METLSRSVRRVGYHIEVPAWHQTISREEAPETISELSPQDDALLEGIELDTPKVRSAAQRRNRNGGYDRNAHRYLDEKRYHRKRRRMLYAVPAAAFALVAVIMLWGPFANQPKLLSAQQASAVTDAGETNVIPLAGSSDEKPAVNYLGAYKVAASRPRILTVESLGIQARVLEVGTDGRQQPQLPKNSYDAGWYNASVLPGEPGATVLSGACSGSVGQGVFRRLNELQKGAEMTLEKGDGTKLVYTVESVETVAVEKLDMTEVLMAAHGFNEGLNLVGCAGTYDIKTNDFASRVVVFAVRI